MGKIKNKIYDWKDRLRDRKMMSLVISFIIIIILLGAYAYKKQRDYRQLAENSYNNAFYQLVEYMNNVEKLLAKATISTGSKNGIQTLTKITKETALAQSYLARLPITTEKLENTQKFLNQVGDYSYSLVSKNLNGKELSQTDLDNIENLHSYSVDLENTLNELESELYSGTIKWGELEKKGKNAFEQESDNLSQSSFESIEEDLHQYTGLIYDGAFSENLNSNEQKGIKGNEIDEETAKNTAKKIIGEDKVSNIMLNTNQNENNANINCYTFNAKTYEKTEFTISISKTGGYIVYMNCNREVQSENVSTEDAINIAKEFLKNRNYVNMKETYYMKNNNILTINYAYTQNDIIIYPDLIKVKIGLDNGEVLGIEATKYLNSHEENRNMETVKITKTDALKTINPKLEILSENLAIIPTEWNTEVLCWEVKGKADNNDFLVYINAKTGEEEDVLMIVDTPDGTLTT